MDAFQKADSSTIPNETADQAAAHIALWASERNLTGAQVRVIFEAGMAAMHRLHPGVLPAALIDWSED